jgi:hypothetical protein
VYEILPSRIVATFLARRISYTVPLYIVFILLSMLITIFVSSYLLKDVRTSKTNNIPPVISVVTVCALPFLCLNNFTTRTVNYFKWNTHINSE